LKIFELYIKLLLYYTTSIIFHYEFRITHKGIQKYSVKSSILFGMNHRTADEKYIASYL